MILMTTIYLIHLLYLQTAAVGKYICTEVGLGVKDG